MPTTVTRLLYSSRLWLPTAAWQVHTHFTSFQPPGACPPPGPQRGRAAMLEGAPHPKSLLRWQVQIDDHQSRFGSAAWLFQQGFGMSPCCSVTKLASQAFLSFSISQSLLRLLSVESVIPSNRLVLCHPPSLPAFNLSQHQGLF